MLYGIDETFDVEFDSGGYLDPQTVADAIIIWIANVPADAHLANVDLHPRQVVSAKFNVWTTCMFVDWLGMPDCAGWVGINA